MLIMNKIISHLLWVYIDSIFVNNNRIVKIRVNVVDYIEYGPILYVLKI